MFLRLFLVLVYTVWTSSADHAGHCPDKFESAKCQDYRNSKTAMSMLHEVCSIVPFASGCAVHRSCHKMDSTHDSCHPLNHLVSVCSEFSDTAGCVAFKRSCGPPAELLSCNGVMDLEILSTEAAFETTREICGMSSMAGCHQCHATAADPSKANQRNDFMNACVDPFGTLASLCLEMDMMPCDTWKQWCSMETTKNLPGLCKETSTESSSPHSHHGDHHNRITQFSAFRLYLKPARVDGTPTSAPIMTNSEDSDCVTDPKSASCADYQYPLDSIEEDLLSLCVNKASSMPFMTGCSIWNACKDMKSNTGLCEPFAVLRTICTDMPGMAGCRRVNTLCGQDTRVRQCSSSSAIPQVPRTMQTQDAIVSACASHTMSACFECRGTGPSCPQTLETMSALCFTMPSMQFCSEHRHFCEATNGIFTRFCDPSTGDYLPPMRMYFHTGQRDIILFKSWIPESTIEYVASFFAILVMGIILQALRALRITMEGYWFKKIVEAATKGDCLTCVNEGEPCDPDCEKDCGDQCGKPQLPQNGKERFQRNLLRAVLTGLVTCLEFLLMLIAMTFNVGLFIAVILGISIGALFFGHAAERDYVGSVGPLSQMTSTQRCCEGSGCCG